MERVQAGNGGAAVKAGNHSSQKSAGGGGGANQAPLGAPVAEERFTRQDGYLYVFSADTANNTGRVDTGDAKPDSGMVTAFKRGELNITPVFAKEAGLDAGGNELFNTADPVSARIMASAKAAGSSVNVIQVPRDGSQDKTLAVLQKANGKPIFSRIGVRGSGAGASSDTGALIRLEGHNVKTTKVTASQKEIDSAAKAIRPGSGRAWVPVAVREIKGSGNRNSYEIVGSSNSLAVARRANANPCAYVVGGE